MRVEPASSEFSSNSFTTEAGRSTTSPAAILLATVSERTWMRPMGIGCSRQFRRWEDGRQRLLRVRAHGWTRDDWLYAWADSLQYRVALETGAPMNGAPFLLPR